MSELHLWRRMWGPPRNTGPSITSRPVILTIPQWCTHRSGVKCVQANECPCWSPIVPVQVAAHRGIFTAGTLHGTLLHQGSRPMWVKTSRSPKKLPDPLSGHPPGSISPRRTSILAQSPQERSQVACLAGTRHHNPHGTSAHRYCFPQTPHTGGLW